MKELVILVTGSTDGIGWQTALELMRLGHSVVVHGRSEARAAAAAEKLAEASGKPAPATCAAMAPCWLTRS